MNASSFLATISAPKAATAVARLSPEDIVREKRSYTGAFLKPVLARGGVSKKKRVEAAE
jgi:hypothetical protein